MAEAPDSRLQGRLRGLPSIDRLLQTEPLRSAAAEAPRELAVASAREEVELRRRAVRDGDGAFELEDLASAATARLRRRLRPTLEPVINATGVVVHTNLGRAPLASAALEAVESVGRHYSNLEYDLEQGARGSRQDHVGALLSELTGAEAGLAVNNNAAAVLLALTAVAADREVVVSRGQLVEIGGSFRIPEILSSSGARLVEVGTTNRTRIADYENAIGEHTVALMRVHCSNFRMVGFTEEASIEEVCRLAQRRGLSTIDDIGSGALADRQPDPLGALFAEEPPARRSVAAGADVVCFSGDKLLGGPQAGLVVGRREPVERMRLHPLARALRIDKLSLAALLATLRLHRDPEQAAAELPVLRMLRASEEDLTARADRLRDEIAAAAGKLAEVGVVRAAGRVGGGALPLAELEGPVASVRPLAVGADSLQAALRAGEPPIVARVQDGALLLDPRTMKPDEDRVVAAAVLAALAPAELT